MKIFRNGEPYKETPLAGWILFTGYKDGATYTRCDNCEECREYQINSWHPPAWRRLFFLEAWVRKTPFVLKDWLKQ